MAETVERISIWGRLKRQWRSLSFTDRVALAWILVCVFFDTLHDWTSFEFITTMLLILIWHAVSSERTYTIERKDDG